MFAAFLLGGLVVFLFAGKWWWKKDDVQPEPAQSDLPLLMDLLRRAHGAAAACLTFADHDPIWATAKSGPTVEVLDRAVAAARLAMMYRRRSCVFLPM